MADDRRRIVPVRLVDPREAADRHEELLGLALRAKAGWAYDEGFLQSFEAMMRVSLADPTLTFVVAQEAEVIVGFASAALAKDPAWLEDLWVEPARQGSGFGTALLDAVIDLARAQGASALEWESDPNAEAFYVARGARRVSLHPSSLDSGRLLPRMRLDLGGDREKGVIRAPFGARITGLSR